ncbi:hypothetical protein FFIC_090830 [Fructobacillus ficulneus]|uniref:Uncharacterized protein n=1 Tax=Fructobacillus ficulneus TaxID=157463 RepID=A0A0K8MFI9_9LACO|nr:hypothetical protein FFIC_090830 [Fructobacillus ficulneus]
MLQKYHLTYKMYHVIVNIDLGKVIELSSFHKLSTTKLNEILYENYLALEDKLNHRKALHLLDLNDSFFDFVYF